MKGVLFNLVEEVVVRLYDEDTWDDILDKAGVGGVYSSPGNYPDEEMLGIVAAAAEMLQVEVPALLRIVGHHAFDGLARRYSDIVGAQDDTMSFIRHVQDYIHPEVRKLYPDAIVPEFAFEDLDNGRVRMVYTSPRGLDALAEGLLSGAAANFGEEVDIERPGIDCGPNSTAFDLAFRPA